MSSTFLWAAWIIKNLDTERLLRKETSFVEAGKVVLEKANSMGVVGSIAAAEKRFSMQPGYLGND